MQGGVRIEDLRESNIDDLIYVCSSKKLEDPIHQRGIALKKNWLREILRRYGSIAKIAYLQERPVAQILFYPEEADPTRELRRVGVMQLSCIYNPFPEARRMGIGSRLLQSLVEDCREGRGCLRGTPCRFIVTKPFDTGDAFPLPQFYSKKGFKPSLREPGIMYLPISESYQPGPPQGEYEPLPEDRGRALVFYSPDCEFSYPFAVRIAELIEDVARGLPIELINAWERPEESMRRKNSMIIVNAKLIKTFFMEREKFQREVKEAMAEPPA